MALNFRAALISVWLCISPVAFGAVEGDWDEETLFYSLDRWEIGHTHTLRAHINFVGQDRAERGYVFIATGGNPLYHDGEVHFALLSFQEDGGYSLRVREMKGISSTLAHYLKRKLFAVRRRVGGTDTGSLSQVELEVIEGLTGNRSGVMSRAYRLVSAAGLYEITSRPRLASGERQKMILDLRDVKNPIDRSSYCSYFIGAASRWLETRQPFLAIPVWD